MWLWLWLRQEMTGGLSRRMVVMEKVRHYDPVVRP